MKNGNLSREGYGNFGGNLDRKNGVAKTKNYVEFCQREKPKTNGVDGIKSLI